MRQRRYPRGTAGVMALLAGVGAWSLAAPPRTAPPVGLVVASPGEPAGSGAGAPPGGDGTRVIRQQQDRDGMDGPTAVAPLAPPPARPSVPAAVVVAAPVVARPAASLPAVPAALPAGVQGIIVAAARRHGVDPQWMLNIARCESSFNPRAVNPSGPYDGLFQFLPSTFRANGGTDIWDPVQQAEVTATMLANRQAHQWACA